MEQLICHLFGDYLLQSDYMAAEKRRSWGVAAWHAHFYALPFLFLSPTGTAMLVIIWSHVLIDRFGLARYLVWLKNWLSPHPYQPWAKCSMTGYWEERPIWLTTWLLIAADNALHLACNYAALRYL